MNNSYILVCLFTFATTMAKGETRDSILTEPQPKEIALKPLTIDADISARPGGDYHIKRHGEKVEEGRASALLKTQLKASGTVWRKGFTRIDVGGSYLAGSYGLDHCGRSCYAVASCVGPLHSPYLICVLSFDVPVEYRYSIVLKEVCVSSLAYRGDDDLARHLLLRHIGRDWTRPS